MLLKKDILLKRVSNMGERYVFKEKSSTIFVKKVLVPVFLLAVSIAAVFLAPVSEKLALSILYIEDPRKVLTLQKYSWNPLVSESFSKVGVNVYLSDLILYAIEAVVSGVNVYYLTLIILSYLVSLGAYFAVSKYSKDIVYGFIAGCLAVAWLLYAVRLFYNIHVLIHLSLFLFTVGFALIISGKKKVFLYSLMGCIVGFAFVYDKYIGLLYLVASLLSLRNIRELKYYLFVIVPVVFALIYRENYLFDQRTLCYMSPGFSSFPYFNLLVVIFGLLIIYKKASLRAPGLVVVGGFSLLLYLLYFKEIYLWYFFCILIIVFSTYLSITDENIFSRFKLLVIIGKRVSSIKSFIYIRRSKVSFVKVIVAFLVVIIFFEVFSATGSFPGKSLAAIKGRGLEEVCIWIPRSVYSSYYLNAAILPYAPALSPSLSVNSIRYSYLEGVVWEKRSRNLPYLLYVSGIKWLTTVGAESAYFSQYLAETGLREVASTKNISVYENMLNVSRVRVSPEAILVFGDVNFLETLSNIIRENNITVKSAPPVIFVKSIEEYKMFNHSPIIFYNRDYRSMALELYLEKYNLVKEYNGVVADRKVLVLRKGEKRDFPCNIRKGIIYTVWVKALFNASGGALVVKVGDKTLSLITEKELFNPVFLWIELGKVVSGEEASSVEIECTVGTCVLEKLIVVQLDTFDRVLELVRQDLSGRNFVYLYDLEFFFTSLGFRSGVDEEFYCRAAVCYPFKSCRGELYFDLPEEGVYTLTIRVSRVAREIFISYGVFDSTYLAFNIPIGYGYSNLTYTIKAKTGSHMFLVYISNIRPQCIYFDYLLVEPQGFSFIKFLKSIFSKTADYKLVSSSPTEIVLNLNRSAYIVLHEDYSEKWKLILPNGTSISPVLCDTGVCCFKASAGDVRIVYAEGMRETKVYLRNIFFAVFLLLSLVVDAVVSYVGRKRR